MSTRPIKILIADDDNLIRELMSRKIASQDYEVITAKDGQEAWDKIVNELPDVIILDLIMPGMDGWGVLQKLRQEPPGKKWQPVIIVSANEGVESFQKATDMGADHYLTKPFKTEDILKALRVMLSLIPQRNT